MMEKKLWYPAFAFGFVLMGSIGWASDGSKSIAKKFSRAAAKAGVRRLAVLPFVPMDRSSRSIGSGLAERFTTHVAHYGKVEVVERALLQTLLREHRLGQTGLFHAEGLGSIGQMLQAQAIVTGTFVTLGNKVEVQARLIHIETGVIIAARTAILRRTGLPEMDRIIPAPSFITVADTAAEILAYQHGLPGIPEYGLSSPLARRSRKDYDLDMDPNEAKCLDANERINALQEGILELKARHWARQVQKSNFPKELLYKPAEMIPDLGLRKRFLSLVNDAIRYSTPPLSPSEVKRFIYADSEAFLLDLDCNKKFRS